MVYQYNCSIIRYGCESLFEIGKKLKTKTKKTLIYFGELKKQRKKERKKILFFNSV